MFRFAMITLVMTAGLAGSVSASAQQLTEQQANQAAQGIVVAGFRRCGAGRARTIKRRPGSAASMR